MNNLNVKVGLTYLRSDDRKVTILQVDQHGVSQHNLLGDDNDYYTKDGRSLHGNRRCLVKHLPQGKPVSTDDVTVGGCITYMDDLVPSSGEFKDWQVTSAFTISTETFSAMNKAIGRGGMLIQNKAAYLVSVSANSDGDITDVLVIFKYDLSYACATLHAPHHSM